MRVVVTRPEPDASQMAAELRAAGHEAIVEPLMVFEPLDFEAEGLRTARALIVTSGNALRALAVNHALEIVRGCPVFCVGEETARRCRALGFDRIQATAEDARALAPMILDFAKDLQPLAHVTGTHHSFDLAGYLCERGLAVSTIHAYSMGAAGAFSERLIDDFRAGVVDGVVLMSPRTASIFVSLCEKHGIEGEAKSLMYFCLSRAVSARLSALGGADKIRIAEKATRAGLFKLLEAEDYAPHPAFAPTTGRGQ